MIRVSSVSPPYCRPHLCSSSGPTDAVVVSRGGISFMGTDSALTNGPAEKIANRLLYCRISLEPVMLDEITRSRRRTSDCSLHGPSARERCFTLGRLRQTLRHSRAAAYSDRSEGEVQSVLLVKVRSSRSVPRQIWTGCLAFSPWQSALSHFLSGG